jgi:protein O-mannosyl-transferase
MGKSQSFKQVKFSKNKTNQDFRKNKKYYFLLAAVLVLTILIFSNSVKNDFINYDDNVYVYDNSYIKDFSIHGISEIFKAYFKDELPVTLFTLAVDYKLWGLNPGPYHIENIIFHLINILLVFILIRKITGIDQVAFITAILFAVHPLRTESVVWIAERKDMLFGLFYISSVIFYVNYIKSGYKLRFIAFSLIFAILSILAKFSAVSLPFILFLTDYFYSRKFTLRSVLEKIPFFVFPVISGIIHFSAGQQGPVLVSKYFSSYNFIDSIIFAGYSLFFYLNKFLFPFNLSALHTYPAKTNGFLPLNYYICFVACIIILVLIIIWILKAKKIRKELIFGFLFFLIPISIVLHLIPYGGWVIVAERYTYIPYIGLFFITGFAYYKLTTGILPEKFRPFVKIPGLICILLFCILTFNRNKVWENSITLFNDVIEKDSTVYFAYNNRGYARFGNGDVEGALDDFNKTIKINPEFVDGYNNHGNLMNNIKNYPAAIEDFNHVIKANPKYSAAYNNRGNSKVGLKDYSGSIEDYTKAIEIKPDYSLAYNNRGSVLCNNMNDFKGAIKDFNKAIEIDNRYGQAYFNRGISYLNMQDLTNSCPDFYKASQYGYKAADELIQKYCNK